MKNRFKKGQRVVVKFGEVYFSGEVIGCDNGKYQVNHCGSIIGAFEEDMEAVK